MFVPGIKNDRQIFKHLDELFRVSPEFQLKRNSKWVIFSDLHIGDGSKKDDFKLNSNLFLRTLQEYYLNGDFKVILNGDVEELQKFLIKRIMNAWPQLYNIFDQLNQKSAFIKIIGNHDMNLLLDEIKKSSFQGKYL